MIYCRHPTSPLRTILSVTTNVAVPLRSQAICLFLLPSVYARTVRFRNSLQVNMPQYAPFIRFCCFVDISTNTHTHTRTHARNHARTHARTHSRTHTHTFGSRNARDVGYMKQKCSGASFISFFLSFFLCFSFFFSSSFFLSFFSGVGVCQRQFEGGFEPETC